MKRLLVFLILFIIGITLPFGCTGNSPNAPGTRGSGQANELSIYNWSSYIDPEAISEFEKKFSVKVKYDTFESNEALYAKLQAGNPGYDVIFPSDYMVTTMAKENMLEELNHENIPNIKNIDEKFIDPPFDPGNKYSLPYQWGTAGIGYNITVTGGEIDSWQALFDPKFKGRVGLLDEMRSVLSTILIYLGYDPNTTSPDEINKARDFLIEHKNAIAVFAEDNGQLLLDQGQVDLTYEWSGDIFQVMKENANLRYTIPKEGSLIYVDTMAIPKDAPHQELAEKFINFILEPEIGAKISNYIKYATPNKAAREKGLINQDDLKNPSIYPTPEIFARLQYLKDVGDATSLYDEAWTEIKASAGK